MADIEKFGIKVEVDGRDATKSLEDLEKKAKKTNAALNTENSIDIDVRAALDSLEKIDQSVAQLDKNVDGLGQKFNSVFSLAKFAAVLAVFDTLAKKAKGMYNQISEAAHSLVDLDNTAQSLFMNTNNLKAWETAFKDMGFKAKDADATLKSLESTIINQRFNPNPMTAGAFGLLGINLQKPGGKTKNAEEVASEIPGRLQKLDPMMAQYVASLIGISPEVAMQMRNNKDFAKTLTAQRANKVVTGGEVGAARGIIQNEAKIGAEKDKLLNITFEKLDNTINDKLIPPLMRVADALDRIYPPAVNAAFGALNNPGELLAKANNWLTAKLNPDAAKLKAEAERQGYTPGMTNALLAIAHRESGFKNIQSTAVDPKTGRRAGAYGYLQYQPKTIQGYAGAGANPLNITDTVRAFANEYKEFSRKGFVPSPESLSAYHLLGEHNFRKALIQKQNNPNATFNDIFKSQDPSGRTAAQNSGLLNIRFPEIEQRPSASQSPAVSSSITHNKVSNVASNTSIGTVNVNANDPQAFANALRNSTSYLDRSLNMTGQIA